MTTSATFLQHTLPPEVYQVARGLEVWRTSAERGRRIPEGLWAKAARLARTYGVSRVAAALRLSYYDLPRRARRRHGAKTPPPAPPTFIQLPGPTGGAHWDHRGTVEVVHASGARLILRLPAARPEDLLPLVQAFLGHRP
jgi:hypothetical protein